MAASEDAETLTTGEKLRTLAAVARYRPGLTAAVAVLSVLTALLEAVGLSFIVPIIEIAQADGGASTGGSRLMAVFVAAYSAAGVELTLGTAIVGVVLVMFVRYAMSFVVAWSRQVLQLQYQRHLRRRTFEAVLDAEVAFFDRSGSDDIVNAVITQTKYASQLLRQGLALFQKSILAAAYLSIGLYLAPVLTVITLVIFGALTGLVRYVLEPGESVGDRVAAANERIHASVQVGAQGIRDVKLFGLTERIREGFGDALDQYVRDSIKLQRNKAFVRNFYQFSAAVAIFSLIYAALVFTSLSFAELGVFLFAMFRFAPMVSSLNGLAYTIEGNIPHMVRTREFVESVEAYAEPEGSERPPERIGRVAFEDVTFAYDDEQVVRNVSFSMERGAFVALVGPSGAGKSTLGSLLARLYEPDAGRITADGDPIHEFDLRAWRSKVAVVRQDPFLFDETLEYNLTVGADDATRSEMDRVCRVARVDEFFDELPDGYDTRIGEGGVRLSGGQRQRVALARALLTDAEILVLDEATSDLDSHLEADIHSAVESAEGDRTILAIAHRLSTVASADCIHTVEDGRIVESGTHEALIEEDGTYASLYAGQRM